MNCKGEDFYYKLYKNAAGQTKLDSTSDFQKSLLSNFQSLLSWTPGTISATKNGKPYEKPVDFAGSYSIQIIGNKIHIMNEKEINKHFKKKQRK